MRPSEVLDVIEALLRAAQHPDVIEVKRYGKGTEQSPAGVRFDHQTQSFSMLWVAASPRPEPSVVPLPAEMPAPVDRPTRALFFLVQLLDIARPAAIRSWEPVSFPGTHLSPCALRIMTQDGTVAYLRATAGCGPGGSSGEPAQDPFADYQFPEGVRSWRQEVSAVSAA